MSVAEKTELFLIPFIGLLFWVAAPVLPVEKSIGGLFIVGSALLLIQSLVRDLWLLIRARKGGSQGPSRQARCMCMESIAGVLGIISGIALIVFGKMEPVEMTGSCWALVAMLAMGAGFMIKDIVLEVNPVRIYRYKNHSALIVQWKKE